MSKPDLIIAPSILSADFAELGKDTELVLNNGAAWVHVDIMDGHFVPNITFGPPMVKSLRKRVGPEAFLDCHLMVADPGVWVEPFAKAGASQFNFHIETQKDTEAAAKLCRAIKDANMKVAVAVKPKTPVEAVLPLVKDGEDFQPDTTSQLYIGNRFG
eukprot:Protomagalhaensia_wolfi_Nauph_80__3965@NODE_4018_length_658_cov_271_137318_g3182_i0_p1_GENE_NODE_4018_length_658_cov_271_137318_g3182_i0NODE_4018_length_658_cov_271_137318_g3182_i0_p1_ORF_typecomplete_len158_score36_05Ribul_P_3_epim/PF00834_19/5_2e47_NODE_4018_length_658_cov_271_137318_g3182_i0157630